ncbi:MAG TPA: dienelactone hydrolase family protein [Thermoanaerobaculia bacterium]|nr:dienelactone hydrolase family protein [Thermoanaerobaculia bacterium]
MRTFIAVLALLTAACATTPPAQTQRLETMPRHDEWVQIDSAGRKLHAYVVYPQVSRLSGAVLVIHENRGLTDWVRTVADQLAERGYIAIAPDFLSGSAPGGGRTSDFPTSDAAREAISKLPPAQVLADMQNAAAYIRSLPATNKKLAVMGFCWGGARAWEAANLIDDLSGTFVFYGTGPSSDAAVGGIDAPVYGFYGGDDARVNATIEPTQALMTKHGKTFEPVTYPGAGHAYMRLGEEANPTEANRTARDQSWQRLLTELRPLNE